jgi:hypothetical protein
VGSRRRRHAALAAATLAIAAVAGCTAGAPPGFSGGDHWTIPLVGPLEDGLLLVPVQVAGAGPYVFAIDPDAPMSIVDDLVVKEAELRTGTFGPHVLDEDASDQTRIFAEALDLKLGTLAVERRSVMVVKTGTYNSDGREIHGVIGRDILADSLVFGFDRDLGVAYLSTTKSFRPAADAAVISYSILPGRTFPHAAGVSEVVPVSRRLATATIGDQSFAMHLDFGATASQLRERSWERAKLAGSEVHATLIDEAATVHPILHSGLADDVTVGATTTTRVWFVPYTERRWPDQDLEGTLGLGFFRRFAVAVNWDQAKVYLSPRVNAARQVVSRIGRWQSKALVSCTHVGCATITAIDPLAGKPAVGRHPGVVVSVVRDASAINVDLEVLIAATADGNPRLPWLVASMPAGLDRVMTHVSADYLGASLTVIDTSPFPRRCPTDAGCIDQLAPPQHISPRRQVRPNELHRRAGDSQVFPDDDAKTAIAQAGVDRVSATFEVCIDGAGSVDTVTLLVSSGFPSYDRRIATAIKSSWAWDPFVVDGKPIPVCTDLTFIYSQR